MYTKKFGSTIEIFRLNTPSAITWYITVHIKQSSKYQITTEVKELAS